MASPVTPAMIQPLIIADSDTFCVSFTKLLRAFYLFYIWSKYAINEDGIVTNSDPVATWGQDICQYTDCSPPDQLQP